MVKNISTSTAILVGKLKPLVKKEVKEDEEVKLNTEDFEERSVISQVLYNDFELLQNSSLADRLQMVRMHMQQKKSDKASSGGGSKA